MGSYHKCNKCEGLMVKGSDISNTDHRGERFHYYSCVNCGNVVHMFKASERRREFLHMEKQELMLLARRRES